MARGERISMVAMTHAMVRMKTTLAQIGRRSRRLSDALGAPRPFDWHRDAFEDYIRTWPPIVGYGRGRPLLTPEIERHLRIEADREYDRIYDELEPAAEQG